MSKLTDTSEAEVPIITGPHGETNSASGCAVIESPPLVYSHVSEQLRKRDSSPSYMRAGDFRKVDKVGISD